MQIFGMFGYQDKPDALDAVKLDPAVLEAQVTMHAKRNIDTNTNATDVIGNSLVENKKVEQATRSVVSFEDMMSQHEAALLALTPHQLELLMKYADMLRRQRVITQKYLQCAFCKNNGRPPLWYTSHVLKDGRGRVQCPVLRRYRCPRCGLSGDHAHTIKYCPDNTFIDSQSVCSNNTF